MLGIGGCGGDGPAFSVRSDHRTPLAVWTEGAGPPLVLVHGSTFDRRIFDPLVAHLRGSLTIYAMNRRGFRPSGDANPHVVEREFEDVAAVIEAVASRTEQPVAVLGHSYGGGCAMGGAARSSKVHRLILYEPSLGLAFSPGMIEGMEKDLREGRPEELIRGVFVGALDGTEEEFAALQDSPQWTDWLAAAPTLLRESRAESEWVFRPGVMDGIIVPTLMLVGTESLLPLLRSTLLAIAELQNARLHVLKGHGHGAFLEDPVMFASIVRRFLDEAGQPKSV